MIQRWHMNCFNPAQTIIQAFESHVTFAKSPLLLSFSSNQMQGDRE